MTRPFLRRRTARAPERAPERAGAAPTDVYLVGTAYSGTTHLGGLLAANFGAFYAGEVGRLPRYVTDYQVFSDPVGCLCCAAAGQACPVWSDHLVTEVEDATPPRAMRRLRELTGADIIVDGSKLPAWLQTTLSGRDARDARLTVILTARSPLSYAMSAIGATGQPLYLALREWRDINIDALRTATRTQLPVFIARNEEIRADPGTVLDRLAPLLGSPHRVQDLKPAEPTHSVGGNAFVQSGPNAHEVLQAHGLAKGESMDEATLARVTQAASVGSLQRPADAATARTWAQAVIDCPGLVQIAEMLGYQVYLELERFVTGVSDQQGG